MRVLLFVGVFMVLPMYADPASWGVLGTAQAQDSEEVLQPFGASEASVSEQAMEAQTNAKRTENIEAEQCRCQAGPTEEPGYERKQGDQVDPSDYRRVDPGQPERLSQLRNRRPSFCFTMATTIGHPVVV
jgi:hypothetical protein